MDGKASFLWIIAACMLGLFIVIIENKMSSDTTITVHIPKLHSFINIVNYQSSDAIEKSCRYTKLYPGGYGAAIHDVVFAWSWALQHNVSYEGVVGSSNHLKTMTELLRVLKLPFRIQSQPFKNCTLLTTHRSTNWIQMNPFMKRTNTTRANTNRNIVVHIRRGDVNMDYPQTGDYFRYMSNSYFLDLIDKIRKPGDRVIILSQKTESFEDFMNAGYDVRLDTSVVDAWNTMINSDILIMSRSSFSYIPALFAKGIVYYNEFWCRPMKHWVVSTSFPPDVKRSTTMPMKEIVLPCEGGEFGAENIQTYACVLSKKTTIMFTHMPHAAQTIFPCWSWFSEKRAQNCAFVVQDGLSNPWFNFVASLMGCLVFHTQPKKCTVLGMLNTRLTVKPGQNFSWLSSPVDAARLQHNFFRGKVHNKGIGILKRKKNRRIRNINQMNISNDTVYFEDISYFNQSRWMHEHDIIIAAHGAAITYAIFIQKCTVVIQLYPEHYYPNKYYEQLITESGGIPISWIKNKYLGNDSTKASENEAMLLEDFKQHKNDRGQVRIRDIEVDKDTLLTLLQMAKEQRQKCLDDDTAFKKDGVQ